MQREEFRVSLQAKRCCLEHSASARLHGQFGPDNLKLAQARFIYFKFPFLFSIGFEVLGPRISPGLVEHVLNCSVSISNCPFPVG